jgi:hypothetical protein
MMLSMHSLPNAELRLEDLPATGADQTARDVFTLSFDRLHPQPHGSGVAECVWLATRRVELRSVAVSFAHFGPRIGPRRVLGQSPGLPG